MIKILAIEDDEIIREDLIEILEGAGFQALGAENGRIGVKMARLHRPDLILCDVRMPEMNGFEVLETLRADRELASIPFVFLTARAERSDLRKGMHLGADDYLTKPIGQREVLDTIAARLSRQAALAAPYHAQIDRAAKQLHYLTYYDGITDLPNRRSLQEQLKQAIAAADAREQQISLLVIDVDRFYRINSSLGKRFGDDLLKAVSERLLQSVSEDDVVSRLDADEFAIMLRVADATTIVERVNRVLAELTYPFSIANREIYLTASAGIAVYPRDARDSDSLIQHSVLALERAKQQGGNCYRFYTEDVKAQVSLHFELQAGLHRALERHEFLAYYQPQVHLATGQIVGAEVLVRWHHPTYGLLSPAQFIPIAEEDGSIVPLGEWVLHTACREAMRWHHLLGAAGGNQPLPRMSVNLSGRQFQQENLSDRVVAILAETGLPAHFLELELTESMLVGDVEASTAKLSRLKALGVKVSIDDFGKGYSSLGYLKHFPFDTLKIDREFVGGIPHDRKNLAITLALIQLARGLDLKAIAEGVETEAELELLRHSGCDEVQGYAFSPPLPAEQFRRMLLERKPLVPLGSPNPTP